jgi:hypothetical protein
MAGIRTLGVVAILLAVLGASAANPPMTRNVAAAHSSVLAASLHASASAASRIEDEAGGNAHESPGAPVASPTSVPSTAPGAPLKPTPCFATATCYPCPLLNTGVQARICYPCPLLNAGVQLRICYPCPPVGLQPERVCIPCPPFTLQPARLCIPCPPGGLGPLRKCPIPSPPPVPVPRP